jgi:hypothetical protein
MRKFGNWTCRLEVFGEAAVTITPGKGALDHPSAWQDLETDSVGRATHDLDRHRASPIAWAAARKIENSQHVGH